jgi:hypothetical protein
MLLASLLAVVLTATYFHHIPPNDPAAAKSNSLVARDATAPKGPLSCPPPSPVPNSTALLLAVEADRLEHLRLAKVARDQYRLAQPFYCRMDSWILGNWSEDGHTYFPDSLRRPSGDVTPVVRGDGYKILTPTEARECLRGTHLAFLGPSYMRDVFTTLIDLLHDYHRVGYHQMNPPEKNLTLLGSGYEHVEFLNANGFWRDYAKIEANIHRFANHTLIADELVWDINKATVEAMANDASMAEEIYFFNLRRFLVLCEKHNIRLIWMTQMSLEHGTGVSTVPVQFRQQQTDAAFQALLDRTIPMLNEFDIPWLDVFHMAGSCVTDPTETDPTQPCNPSAHSNWYVSAMKMQMVLNHVCRGCKHPKDHPPSG